MEIWKELGQFMLSNSEGLTSSNIYLFIIRYGLLVSLINMSILASLKLLSGQQYYHNFAWGQRVTRHIDPMHCSPAGSYVYGISQARILKSIVISSSRESSRPRDQTCIRFFITEPPGKPILNSFIIFSSLLLKTDHL